MVQKFLFFTISHIRHLLMLPLTCVALKMVSILVADFYVVNNLELFMLFGTRSYIFCATNTGECVISNYLARLDLKLKHHFMRTLYEVWRKTFKTSYNSIVRNCEFLCCAETELSVFF